MKRFNVKAFLLLALALLAAPSVTLAAQSYDNCTNFITVLPAVISTSGTWCFNANLSTSITSGKAITVNTNDVTINCNDFKLDGLGAGAATTTTGISATNRLNVTVRRCRIRGFYYGLFLSGGSGHLAEDNGFDGNTYVGMRVDGAHSVMRHNQVVDTGGSTVAAAAAAFGIVGNSSVDVLENSVTDVVARLNGNGFAYGVYTTANINGSINGNRIHTILKDGTGTAYGINNATSDRVTMRDNDLLGNGGAGSFGLRCATANGSAKNNVVLGFSTGLSVCSNDGGNVFAP